MSELPWENKKVADIMSSAGEEARISDGSSPDANNSSAPQIPDILANAFADVPMEEAKIEDSDPAPGAETNPVQETVALSFGDLPDFSALGAESKSESEPSSDDSPLSGILPPSMGNFDAPAMQETSKIAPPASMPIFDPDSPDIGGIQEIVTSEQPVKKRSPPPLFDPSHLDGEPHTPEMAPPIPIPENSPMSSSPNELSIAVPSEGVNPFETPSSNASPSAGVNPFEAPSPAAPPSVGVNPFESPSPAAPPSVGVNPFEAPSSDASPSVGANPFETQSPAANPFESPGLDANPFAQSAPTTGPAAAKKLPDIGVPKVNVNVDSLKKNIEGISTIAKGLFKNLTKGKSLIERMDDMRADPSSDAVAPDDNTIPVSSSPFESDSASPFESPSFNDSPADGINPFEPSISDVAPSVNEPSSDSVNPFELPVKQEDSIREVIPVEKPAEEVENADPFESPSGPEANDDSFDESEKFSPDSDIMDIIPVENNLAPETGDELVGASEKLSCEVPDVIGESISLSDGISSDATDDLNESSALSSELKDMKKSSDEKFSNLETDIGEFKDNLTNVDTQFSSIQEEVRAFSSKISELDTAFSSFVKSNEGLSSDKDSRLVEAEGKLNSVEVKIGDFESSLSVLQSDNVSIKSGLLKVEDSVSELVESYTALLVQLHESFQENESNFARIDMISEKLDEIGSKINSIEKVQEGSRETSMEFSRSISSILDNLGNTSSAFSEFKQESENKDAGMLEKIDSVTEYVETELKKLGARSHKGFGKNVHLSNILKNSSNMKLCMEWLEFLMELVGRNNLPDILSYYEELGWITEQVRLELLHYADGIDFYMEKPDWKLTPDDHVKSIWFIESLAGMKVDKNRLSVIDRDIEKVKKGTEIYGI